MVCPKCQSEMEKVRHGRIEVDRCTVCRGLWFDMASLEQLRQMEGSEAIDIGSAAEGQKWNQVTRVDCPDCGTRLVAMVDRIQPSLWYEVCPTCYGVFFDAGEFREFKAETVLDRFRNLFAEHTP